MAAAREVAVTDGPVAHESPLRLRDWPENVRDLYRREQTGRLNRESHFLFFLGLLSALGAIAIDAIIWPGIVAEGAILRVLAIAPFTLIGLIALDRGWRRVVGVCVCAAPIGFVAVLAHLSSHFTGELVGSYLTGIALVVGVANLVMPLSFRGVVAFDLAFVAVVAAILASDPRGSLLDDLDHIALIGVMAAFTLPLASRFERLRQHNFLLNLRARDTEQELRDANRRLRELSESDPLTGILNRRGFERAFDEAAELYLASAETGRPAVMMIDLDHFKRFNDSHGHQAGDTCLVMVAQVLAEVFAAHGWIVARYGGEEFIAASPRTNEGEAVGIARQLRNSVGSLAIPVGGGSGGSGSDGRDIAITASVGIGLGGPFECVRSRAESQDLREELIEMADAALYGAKRAGRDRAELVDKGDPVEPCG